MYVPHCRWPAAGPSVRCRGQTGRCQPSLSGGLSETPGFDTRPHKTPPRWHRLPLASWFASKLTTVYQRGSRRWHKSLPNASQLVLHPRVQFLFHMKGQRWAGGGRSTLAVSQRVLAFLPRKITRVVIHNWGHKNRINLWMSIPLKVNLYLEKMQFIHSGSQFSLLITAH